MDYLQKIREKIEEIKAKTNKEREESDNSNHSDGDGMFWSGFFTCLKEMSSFVDSLPEEPQPKYSFFEHVYHCGTESMWKIGDTLAIYEFYSDREGENVLGEIVDIKMVDTEEDRIYIFKDGSGWYENDLISEQAYKKSINSKEIRQ